MTSGMSNAALEILKDLVRIDSVNPSLVKGGAGEGQIAAFLHSFLARKGIESTLQEVSAGRFNVIASVTGALPGPRFLLNGHLDTVSVEGMVSPFEPVERDGRVYGRGAQDMKSGLASGITALLAASQGQAELKGEVVLAAVADEEDQSLGTQYFLRHWPVSKPFDFALVMEPTDLKVCTAHKGFAWLEVRTLGVAAHGSRPREGVDAIRAMGQVLQELDLLEKRLERSPAHPLLGPGSLHASFIEGGREWSSYPDQCLLKYERRTLPHESPTRLEEELNDILGRLQGHDPRFKAEVRLVFWRAPFLAEREQPEIARFYRAAKSHLPDDVDWGAASFWTDAALLSEAGIPSLVFGPRGAGLHSVEEYVLAADVGNCAEIIYRFVMSEPEA
jgi:acetylornithine deacetylase